MSTMQMHEILDETVEFYRDDPSLRAMEDDAGCRYETADGRTCAVGRCMVPEHRRFVEDVIGIASVLELSEYFNPNKLHQVATSREQTLTVRTYMIEHKISSWQDLLLPQYRGHSVVFWKEIQELHDHPNNWTSEGLSWKGELVRIEIVAAIRQGDFGT